MKFGSGYKIFLTSWSANRTDSSRGEFRDSFMICENLCNLWRKRCRK